MCLTLLGQEVGERYMWKGNGKLEREGWEEPHIEASERQACPSWLRMCLVILRTPHAPFSWHCQRLPSSAGLKAIFLSGFCKDSSWQALSSPCSASQPGSEQELGEHLGTDSPPGPLSFLTSIVFGDLLFLLGGSNSLCKRIDACSFCRSLWQPVLPVSYLSSLSTLQRPPFEPCPPGQEPSRSPGRPAPGSSGSSGSSVGGTCDVLSFSLTLALSYP